MQQGQQLQTRVTGILEGMCMGEEEFRMRGEGRGCKGAGDGVAAQEAQLSVPDCVPPRHWYADESARIGWLVCSHVDAWRTRPSSLTANTKREPLEDPTQIWAPPSAESAMAAPRAKGSVSAAGTLPLLPPDEAAAAAGSFHVISRCVPFWSQTWEGGRRR